MSLKPITNRTSTGKFQTPEDGWIQLIPKGRYPVTLEGGGKPMVFDQVLDDASLASIADRFTPEKGNVRIDQEHWSYDTSKSSEAYGWIDEVQVRADGLYGQVRWTEIGNKAVEGGTYRYVSPVWLPEDVEKVGPGQIRPLRLDSVGLTNNPNLKGMRPITNRAGAPAWLAGEEKPADETKKPKTMRSVATELRLNPDASEEAILGAVRAVLNRATSAESTVTTLTTENARIKTDLQTFQTERIEADLKPIVNRAKPEDIERFRKLLGADRASALPILESFEKTLPAGTKVILNRNQARTPAEATASGDKVKAQQVAVSTYMASNRVDFETAWNAVRLQQPELFA